MPLPTAHASVHVQSFCCCVFAQVNTAAGPDSGWMATQNASGRVMNIGWATVCGGAAALTTLREIKCVVAQAPPQPLPAARCPLPPCSLPLACWARPARPRSSALPSSVHRCCNSRYDPSLKTLVSNPVEELDRLRGSVLANISAPVAIPAGGTSAIPGTEGVDAAASSDLLVTFTLPADGSAASFGVCVLSSPGNTTSTDTAAAEEVDEDGDGAAGPGPGAGAVGGPWRPDGLCGDAANSVGIPVLANLSAVDAASGQRTGVVSIGTRHTGVGHPFHITLKKGEAEFDMRVLVDRCIVEAFMMGGRADFTSMGPTESRAKGGSATTPGTKMLLMGHSAITVKSAVVHAMGAGCRMLLPAALAPPLARAACCRTASPSCIRALGRRWFLHCMPLAMMGRLD